MRMRMAGPALQHVVVGNTGVGDRSELRLLNAVSWPVVQSWWCAVSGSSAGKKLGVGFASIGVAFAMLVGCGGGGYIPGLDPDDLFDWFYGSIALNPDNLAIAITANQPSQETSDAKAVETCGGGACLIVLRYSGKDACAAIARATNKKYGVGEGSSKSSAMSKALDECQAQGGQDCEPGLAECNDGG